MLKKQFEYFQPLLFGLATFLLYLVLYSPTPKSEDFITAILVIFTGIAWSSVIVFSKKRNKALLFFYITLSVGSPLLVLLPFGLVHNSQHHVLLVLMALGVVLLKLFISYHMKSEARMQAKSGAD